MIEEVEKITNTEYNGDYEIALSDLLDEYNELKQEFEDYKNQDEIKDVYDYYGVSRSDFYD